ncbi:uncharacterized protein LTR77_001450 [Saxophila tyrrhenica]|uniref:Protein kinase domain-containing protein n=1 Tax=Saxophila tyrrhenica TaxID=1690608 RepID=A0AAV9PKB4_9PEZI|nr:hypothetical protein LTR77_001450 [Saxophila tyrrhenica]
MAAVAHPSRPTIRRNSPLSVSNGVYGFSSDAPMLRRIDIGDSDSDDEPPPAIKFSKETQALLAGAPPPSSPPRHEQQAYELPRFKSSIGSSTRAAPGATAADTPSRAPGIKIIRRSSPPLSGDRVRAGSTPPRVVQIGGNKGSASSGKRSISIAGPYQQRYPMKRDPTPTHEGRQDVITPAPGPRALRVRTRSNSALSQEAHGSGAREGARSANETGNETSEGEELRRSITQHHAPETVSRLGTSTVGRSRNPSADPAPPPGSTRIKRAPNGTGSFLKSGPVRRGFRRRDSEDNISPNDEAQHGSASQNGSNGYFPTSGSATQASRPPSRTGSVNEHAPAVEPVSIHDFAQKGQAPAEARPPSRQTGSYLSRSQMSNDSRPPSRNANERVRSRQTSVEPPQVRKQSSVHHDEAPALVHHDPPQRRPSIDQPQSRPAMETKPAQQKPAPFRTAQYRYAAPKINTDASEDQENMPPPTFKRNKDAEFKHLGKPSNAVLQDENKPKAHHTEDTPVRAPAQQEQRKVLGAISGNTPHRAAPAPPPKMSVLETATTTGGASVTKSKKKRSHIVINGKIFTQMGKVGTGGSSQVFCVMAENFNTFALKKVKLKDVDEAAVRGYKGEIDLLKKLTEVERVIRLFDWELNNDKQELLVLMEKGDTDLNRLLTLRLNGDKARFDPVFTRYHWREMLECVQAVHDMDIVHSDLKPANFLLVQGRLKLIDFGIANAIDTDNTVNVHRDSHVGTPNYMSPESITDTNAPAPGEAREDGAGRPLTKDIKIGKASDVWSLGCILYQMTYGRPPFAHIQSQLPRILAITNKNYAISFPDVGLGDIPVPASLKGVLRKCLNRDPDRRPTVKQLLSDGDVYMNPEQPGTVMMGEELLRQIIGKVVERCRKDFPGEEEVRGYPRGFMEKIRGLVEYA